jgi:hypothetical protein
MSSKQYVAHHTGGEGLFILTDKKLNGFSDRLRRNLETLDEQIENARAMSKPKTKEDRRAALQWSKTLRDLIELRNATLANVKAHLLGRDETGLPTEPVDYYDGNGHVMFERDFQNLFLAPWHESDLKLECEDCGVNSEKVSTRCFPGDYAENDELLTLCEKCYRKRTAKEEEESSESENDESDSSEEVSEEAEKTEGAEAPP